MIEPSLPLPLRSLHEFVAGWGDWSRLVGLIENDAKLQVATKHLHLIAELTDRFGAAAVRSEVTFLGVTIVSRRRKHANLELSRLGKTRAMMSALATLKLPATFFYRYCRIFALSLCSSGWLGRLLPLSESRALKHGAGVNRSSNEWSRAVVSGGLSHLDCVIGANLMRVASSLYKAGKPVSRNFGVSPCQRRYGRGYGELARLPILSNLVPDSLGHRRSAGRGIARAVRDTVAERLSVISCPHWFVPSRVWLRKNPSSRPKLGRSMKNVS
eukprot:s304_g63.t1